MTTATTLTTGLPQHDPVHGRLRAVKKRTPAPLKTLGRRSLRRLGTATAATRPMPDFLVIGTKRGGTTSIWNWLLAHPGVLPMFPAVQQLKSPHYFDISYARGEDWYRSHFPTQRARERAGRHLGYRPVVGESSPYYMFHPAAPGRVHAAVPDVRLVVLLRDPVKRAYSNYWERRGSGFEPLPTFAEAVEAEESRLAGEAERLIADPTYYSLDHDCHSYLARGRYLEHLRPWLELFPRERLLVLLSEDLYADPVGALARTHRFLGLPVLPPPRVPHHNRLTVDPIDPGLARTLRDYYRPHNQALAADLGMELPWDA
jgi:hypothetical protein